jgi:hypothetical protein
MRIPLVKGSASPGGRTATDSAKVCVVDEAFANRYWPGQDPIGKHLEQNPVYDKDKAIRCGGRRAQREAAWNWPR